MHVLFLPKWYPGRNDPQLGDFIRKQALAVAGQVKTSTLFVIELKDLDRAMLQEVSEEAGLWELRCYYRPSRAALAPLRKVINLRRWWQSAMTGWKRLERERGRPDLCHVHIMVRPALIARWAKRRHAIPYLISEQSSEYLDGTWAAKSVLFKWIVRMLFRTADRVTAVSTALGDALRGHRLSHHVDVVPNMVPGLDRPLPPPGPPGHFLVVADLVDRTKNVSGALRAFAMARGKRDDLSLDIIGDGPDRTSLEQLARTLGLDGGVRFLGRVSQSEVMDHMTRTGTVVVNSNVETFSVVTGEALAMGRPVIATRCGGPTTFITPANGVLIEPRDDDALAREMLAMAADASRYDAAKIRATVSERFGRDAVGRAFAEVYQHVISNDRD